MSQEKVERYKEQKANRKDTMKKEKRIKILRNTVASVICVVLVGWIGYSGVAAYIESRPRETVEVDYAAITDFEEKYFPTEE